MLNSAAWASLSPQDRAVYVELRRRFNGRNNGRIGLSVREAAELCRMNRDTAAKSFRKLEETGFIEMVTPGGFTRKDRHSTEWRLTTDLCDVTGAAASKAFQRWRPKTVAMAQ
jgi:DNA-binding IclR family transcriptional regulator